MSKARALELEYKRAFDEFARVVGRVQALLAQPDNQRQSVETARADLERARVAYIQARDAWAEVLLASSEQDGGCKSPQHQAKAVA
ncbi:MAG TPA: hypothetical protein VMB25_16595 [Bryobacteraceae bacterium]|nr:hypothetical protein [Bryobacteraceae bacterium]